MLTNRLYCAVMAFAACMPFAMGCSSADATRVALSANTSHAGQSTHDHGGHAGHDHGDHAHGANPEIVEALASLSAKDRAAAETQKICPVTEEPLGSMGAPMKVAVQGRDVFICCEGCKDALNDDPATFLAKLPK